MFVKAVAVYVYKFTQCHIGVAICGNVAFMKVLFIHFLLIGSIQII